MQGRKNKLVGSIIANLKYDIDKKSSSVSIEVEGTLFSPSKFYKYDGEIIKPKIEYKTISEKEEEMRFRILTAEPYRIIEKKEYKEIALFKGLTGLWILDLMSGSGDSEEYE